jgi:hypothetical protein
MLYTCSKTLAALVELRCLEAVPRDYEGHHRWRVGGELDGPYYTLVLSGLCLTSTLSRVAVHRSTSEGQISSSSTP